MKKVRHKTADEAQEESQKEYYRSSITTNGVIGGPDMPVTYRGNGQHRVVNIPQNQKKR